MQELVKVGPDSLDEGLLPKLAGQSQVVKGIGADFGALQAR